MLVFRYIADSDKYDCLDNMGTWDMFDDGKPLAASWVPPRVPYYARRRRSGDFPSLVGRVPVFSEKAWRVLEPLVGKHVEALSLITDTEVVFSKQDTSKRTEIRKARAYGPYYAINVLDTIDCLDEEQSIMVGFVSGYPTHIRKYVFKNGCIANDQHIFRLPQTKFLHVLVSEEFKRVVEKNKLKGAMFVELGEA